MKIGELSERTGLSRDTIRFYEREGLICSLPSESKTNNYRDYPEDVVEKLGFVVRGRAAGMTVADMRELRDAVEAAVDKTEALEIVNSKITALREAQERTAKLIDFLQMLSGKIDEKMDC